MMTGQFLRIERLAGGVACSNRDFIKAAHTKLNATSKSRELRRYRHKWLRDGLAKRKQASLLV